MAYRLSRYISALFEISHIGKSQDELYIGYGYQGTHWAMTSGYPGSKKCTRNSSTDNCMGHCKSTSAAIISAAINIPIYFMIP